jgi:hypothetical protein
MPNRHQQVNAAGANAAEALRTKPQWRPFKDPARILAERRKAPFALRQQMRGTFIAQRPLHRPRREPFALG